MRKGIIVVVTAADRVQLEAVVANRNNRKSICRAQILRVDRASRSRDYRRPARDAGVSVDALGPAFEQPFVFEEALLYNRPAVNSVWGADRWPCPTRAMRRIPPPKGLSSTPRRSARSPLSTAAR